ncbi:MAG: hypothetical protein HOY71_52630 [Nonomuraea sp.]|nr:hypothetical protein [Nonomuraea sp.]
MGHEEDLRGIQSNVTMVIEQFSRGCDFELGLNRESVAWLDGFVERQRVRMAPEEYGALPSVVGSFLGACIIEAVGCRWAMNDEVGWGLLFPSENWVFPIVKARKHFDEGSGDSILAFYDVTLAMVASGML